MHLLAAGAVSPQDITIFFLSVGILLGLARLLGEVARRFGQPTVLGEILAGVLLGSTVFGAMAPDLYHALFPSYVTAEHAAGAAAAAGHDYHPVRIGLEMFLTLCVALLLLVAGLEVDLSSVWRQGKAAVSVSLTGMVIPFAIGFGVAWVTPSLLGKDPGGELLPFALFIGIAMSITALPVIAKILMDLNMLKSDLGMLIMSSAMVNDLLGWVGFALVLAMIADPAAAPTGNVGTTVVLTLLFVGLALSVGKYAFHKTLPYIQAHSSWPAGTMAFVLVLAMLGASFTEWIGIHSIFGAFIIGIAIGDSAHLKQRTREHIEQFVSSFFAPLFFASIGLRVNFVEDFNLGVVLMVLAIAVTGKLFGCYFGGRLAGMKSRESWATGAGMCARGAMEIILGQLALSAGLITSELFVAIVIMALVTSMFPGPVMQWLLQHKQKHSFVSALPDRRCIVNLNTNDKREAIRQLTNTAAEIAELNEEDVFQRVWAREQMQSTGLESGVAVPHAAIPGLKRAFAVVGIAREGIDFNSFDGEPSRLICLLISSAESQRDQIELLTMVAHAFHNDTSRKAAIDAQGYTEFLAALSTTAKEEQHA